MFQCKSKFMHFEWSMHVLYCLEQIRLLSADLVGLPAFRHILWNWWDLWLTPALRSLRSRSSKNVQPERSCPVWFTASFLILYLCARLWILVLYCVPVRSNPAFFISLDKLSHNGLFLPDEDGCSNWYPVRSYLPKVAVTISSHNIAKLPCLLGSPLKHVYLKIRSEVVSNERESALFHEAGFLAS